MIYSSGALNSCGWMMQVNELNVTNQRDIARDAINVTVGQPDCRL